MTNPSNRIERGGFIVLLALITIALAMVAAPFLSAIMWAALAAIMFQPLYLAILKRFGGHENLAALAALLIIFTAVIVPAIVIGTIVVEQAVLFYLAIRDQQIDPAVVFQQLHDALPTGLRRMVDNSGYGEFAELQARVTDLVQESVGLLARQALSLGGSVFGFVLSLGVGLYVTYFLLRDGQRIGPAVRDALPLEHDVASRLTERFIIIVRATIKGSIVVGLVQGALGAATFWIAGVPAAVLFGVLMALFSLLPAIGAAIVWAPVAIYLLAIGAVWQAIVVLVSGVAVIGMADNVLRPILVGRDTGIPDWVVLISTLGGIGLLGLGGIVIGPVVAGLFLAGWSILTEQRRRDAAVVQKR